MSDNLIAFLNAGGQLVIKKEKDRFFLVTEATLDGKEYHSGVIFKSSEDLFRIWSNTIDAAIVAIKRKEKQLEKEHE